MDREKLSRRDFEFWHDAHHTATHDERTDDLTGADLKLYAERILVLLGEKYPDVSEA